MDREVIQFPNFSQLLQVWLNEQQIAFLISKKFPELQISWRTKIRKWIISQVRIKVGSKSCGSSNWTLSRMN